MCYDLLRVLLASCSSLEQLWCVDESCDLEKKLKCTDRLPSDTAIHHIHTRTTTCKMHAL